MFRKSRWVKGLYICQLCGANFEGKNKFKLMLRHAYHYHAYHLLRLGINYAPPADESK